ncbi:MAG: TonB-dependent receptor [Methylophilaceae bacterium 17-44-8]|nr:MAG: TonB-dependent receptor [Methylophilaceae bacterium 17-44-8]
MILKHILSVVLWVLPMLAYADHDEAIVLDDITVTAPALDSRIIRYPATVETYNRQQIQDTVNATTSMQTLKYLPSFQVRERYIGDRNGPIATRTTGTLSSAQTMLYANGILLSNLLGNSFSFPPRWGFVSPEEIESVSILYGPFSALYAGNSFGGVVNLNTRMPSKLEAHANVQGFMQNFEMYGTDKTAKGNHESGSIGNKVNDLSFLLTVDRLESESQPMQFANATSLGAAVGARTAVNGAYRDRDQAGNNRVIFGATGLDKSEQINSKVKLAYDITPELKATYSLGMWDLNSRLDVESYIKDAAGNPVYNGRVSVDGQNYDVSGFNNPAEAKALHVMQALDVKSNTKGFFDWQMTLSDYDYQQDKNSASNVSATGSAAAGNPYSNRIGRVTDLAGTGWTVFDARATLRPMDGNNNQHEIDVGYHLDAYQLESDTYNTADWSKGDKTSFFGSSRGKTNTQALYVQDKWQMNPAWALTLGGRTEYWEARGGRNQTATSTANCQTQSDTKFSPKLSLSYEPEPAWGFRAAAGQAFRFPTVSELYQQLSQGSALVENNPNLKPEEVISTELTAERRFNHGLMRASLFHESKFDALIGQTVGTGAAIPFGNGTCGVTTCSFIQNIDHVRTNGIELSTIWENVAIHGLDILANATFTDAEILQNGLSPATQGNKPVRIPKQQYKVVATYHQGNQLTYTLAARYSGRQYNTLENSDINPDTFGGTSKFFFVDVKANYQFADRLTASIGVDNLNNYKAFVFHPYPQRTGYIQLKFDY